MESSSWPKLKSRRPCDRTCRCTLWLRDAMWLYASLTSTGSNIEMASIPPWHTSQWSTHFELWKVAGNQCILDSGATCMWIHMIGRRARAPPVLSSTMSSHPESVVPWCELGPFDRQWTRFDNQVSAWSIEQAFSAISTSISGLPNYHEIPTFSIILAKHGFMADTLLILALPSFRSLWLFPMSMLSFSPNCRSHSWASQDSVRPFTPRLIISAPEASWMTRAMHGMWFLKSGHWIAEASSVDCNVSVIE